MSKKQLFTLLLLMVFLLPAQVSSAIADHIVINEIYVDAFDESGSEFLILYNPTDLSVSIEGWKIKTDASVKDATLPAGAVVRPKGFYLIADIGWENSKDDPAWAQADYEETISLYNADAGISLLDNAGLVVDAVGYGANISGGFEGTPISQALIIEGEGLKRISDGWDTNNNEKDFKSSSQEEKSEEKPDEFEIESSINGVYINEFMTDPARPKSDITDEWIELYNSTDKSMDISGSIIRDTVGVVRQYTVPEGIIIKAKSYITFYSSATKITLNNDGDAVELLDRTGTLISQTPNCEKGESGWSFALAGKEWGWTLSPTPNAENLILLETDNGAVTTAKKKATASKSKSKKTTKGPTVKKTKSKGSVRGAKTSSENDRFVKGENAEGFGQVDDRTMGIGLIIISFLGGMYYFNNREKLYEYFEQKR